MRNQKLSARALSDGLSEISELQGLAGENLNRLSTLINGFRHAFMLKMGRAVSSLSTPPFGMRSLRLNRRRQWM